MKKRILSLFAVLLILALALTGCGRKKEPEAQEPEPTAEPEATIDPHAGMVEVTDGAGGTIWVDEAAELTEFPMDRTLFSVENGVARYDGEGYTLLRGVDVSEYQGAIDWTAVRESGVEFALLRCGWRGYSGGSLNEDTYFLQNVEGASAVGIKVGAYFFSQAVSVAEAAEEAVFTAKLLEGLTLDLPVFYDWEVIGTQPARTDDWDARTVTDGCLEFCDLMESAGYEAGVYSYIPHVYSHYVLDDLAGLSVWMGDPGNFPEFYYEHSIWQYSVTGSVPGIDGDVDLDVMYMPVPAAEDASASAASPADTGTAGAQEGAAEG